MSLETASSTETVAVNENVPSAATVTVRPWSSGRPPSWTVRPDGHSSLTDPVKTIHKAWTTGVFGARYAFHPHAIFGNTGVEPAFKASDTFNLILLGLLVVLLVVGISRLPPDLWTYSCLVMLAPFLTPSPYWALTSFNRYLLAPFPLFVVLGWLLTRVRWTLVPWLAASAGAGVYLTLLFATWRWVA